MEGARGLRERRPHFFCERNEGEMTLVWEHQVESGKSPNRIGAGAWDVLTVTARCKQLSRDENAERCSRKLNVSA